MDIAPSDRQWPHCQWQSTVYGQQKSESLRLLFLMGFASVFCSHLSSYLSYPGWCRQSLHLACQAGSSICQRETATPSAALIHQEAQQLFPYAYVQAQPAGCCHACFWHSESNAWLCHATEAKTSTHTIHELFTHHFILAIFNAVMFCCVLLLLGFKSIKVSEARYILSNTWPKPLVLDM